MEAAGSFKMVNIYQITRGHISEASSFLCPLSCSNPSRTTGWCPNNLTSYLTIRFTLYLTHFQTAATANLTNDNVNVIKSLTDRIQYENQQRAYSREKSH
jgi:hypothetical protein